MINWMLIRRRPILQHVANKRPVQAPSNRWWVLTAAIEPILSECNVTLVKLQSPNLIIVQQAAKIENLIVALSAVMSAELVDVNEAYKEMEETDYVKEGQWWIRTKTVIDHIDDQGSWARDLLRSFSAAE